MPNQHHLDEFSLSQSGYKLLKMGLDALRLLARKYWSRARSDKAALFFLFAVLLGFFCQARRLKDIALEGAPHLQSFLTRKPKKRPTHLEIIEGKTLDGLRSDLFQYQMLPSF